MLSLQGKVVVITGGGGHLGRAMSEALAEFGATLIVGSRNLAQNRRFCKQLMAAYPCRAEGIELDIADGEAVNRAMSDVIARYGKIDVLINNSYYGAGAALHDMAEQDWLAGIDGSINGAYRCTRAVIGHMMDNKSGKIIHIASMYGLVAPDVSLYEGNNFYNPGNYGSGKAAIIQFTKYVAAVYGRYGITCNCISPGPFPNRQVQEDKPFVQSLAGKVPLGRIGRPSDLKGVIVLLASAASDYVNGANIVVDGGWTAW